MIKIIGICLLSTLIALSATSEGHVKQIETEAQGSQQIEQGFLALGNDDPEERIKNIGDFGPFPAQVEVHFDSIYKDLQMRFCPPGKPVLVTENNIEFSNGYGETYDPETGIGGSFEVWGDFQNRYTSMWIESANEARIKVKWRSALVAPREGKPPVLAHKDIYSRAPFGDGYGDWVEETFFIYPDASRTRYAKIYTGLAQTSRPFGYDRTPPKVVHEFAEAIVWNYNGVKTTGHHSHYGPDPSQHGGAGGGHLL